MNNQPIGFLDSGVGGLTVVKEVWRLLPQEQVIFIGDQANLPYGEKSAEDVVFLVKRLVDFLLTKNVKMIVMACNTATALALPIISRQVDVPIVGVIGAGSSAACQQTRNQQVGVIATPATIKSHAYKKSLQQLNNEIQVHELATPNFVPLVEQNAADSLQALQIVERDLKPLLATGIDTLILGCTHYPLLAAHIQKVVGSQVNLVDAGKAAVSNIEQELRNCDLMNESKPAAAEFYTTGNVEQFDVVASSWLGDNIHAQQVKFKENDFA